MRMRVTDPQIPLPLVLDVHARVGARANFRLAESEVQQVVEGEAAGQSAGAQVRLHCCAQRTRRVESEVGEEAGQGERGESRRRRAPFPVCDRLRSTTVAGRLRSALTIGR